MLERLGYKVVCAENGFDGLKIFKEAPHKFDIVITDQAMPHMTGLMFARELLLIRPEVPVILCTGYSENINSKTINDAGIKSFIMKPISKKKIAGAIRKALGMAESI